MNKVKIGKKDFSDMSDLMINISTVAIACDMLDNIGDARLTELTALLEERMDEMRDGINEIFVVQNEK